MRVRGGVMAAIAVGLAAWAFFFRGPPPGGPPSGAALPQDDPALAAEKPEVRREEVSPGPTAAPPATIAAAPTFELLVVDAATEAPVAGAHVEYSRRDEEWAYPIAVQWTDRDWLAAHAESFTTDADGRVMLPRFERRAHVVACGDGTWGDLYLALPLPGTPRVLVHPVRSIEARVVDPRGRPVAGVPLVVQAPPQGFLFCGTVLDDVLWRGTSRAADATATITPVHAVFDGLLFPRESRGVTGAPYLMADILERDPQVVRLDPWRLPDEAVELRLPETGGLRVEVCGADGRRVTEEVECTVTIRGRHSPSMSGLESFRRRTDGGVLDLPFVEVGATLVVYAAAADGRRAGQEVPGPSRAGESRSVVLRLAPPAREVAVTGRILDPAGAPLCLQALRGTVTGGEIADRPTLDVTTDASGGFRLPLGSWKEGHVLRLWPADPGDPGMLAPRFLAEVTLPAPPPLGNGRFPIPLGDLVAAEQPLLVGGQVVTPDGVPVPAAAVMLSPTGRQPITTFAHTGADGRFVLHLDPDRVRRSLDVSKAHYDSGRWRIDERGMRVEDWIRFVPGQDDLEVVLTPQSRREGRVLLDPEVPPSVIRLREGDSAWSYGELPRPDGGFELYGTAGPAAVDVVLDCGGGSGPVVKRVDFVRADGAEPLEIDLRGVIRKTVLEVLDEEGRPCPFQARLQVPGAESCWSGPLGVVVLYSTGAGALANVVPDQGLPEQVELVAGRQTLVRRRGIPVQLRLQDLPDLPDGVALIPCLTPADASEPEIARGMRWFGLVEARAEPGTPGVYGLCVSWTGPYEVSWMVSTDQQRSLTLTTGTVEVTESTTTFAIAPPDADAIQRALEY